MENKMPNNSLHLTAKTNGVICSDSLGSDASSNDSLGC